MSHLLSLEEAAKRLGIGRSTTKALLGKGRLKSLKIGKRRLVPESAIDELIAELEREQNEAANVSVA
jgi:excisionase family DNA binding protein